jgi:ABC-type spermidine/putrescine transport system permease subunit I
MVVPLAITVAHSLHPNALLPPGQTAVGVGNYVYLVQRRVYVDAFARTLRLATYVVVAALLLGYPTALILRRLHARFGSTLILALSFPILAGPLVVVMGWMLLLPRGGLVNTALVRLGLVAQPIQFIGTEVAVVVALVQYTLAFVVLNIFNSLVRIDTALLEAAGSLGADPIRTFRYVTWPLSLPGVVSGSLIAFTLAVSAFVAPHYLGGETIPVVTTLIAQFMFGTFNWELASTAAVLLVLITVSMVGGYNRAVGRVIERRFGLHE